MAARSVYDLVVEDHNKLRSLYSQFQLPGTTTKRKQMLVYEIIREASMHSATEEQALYPVSCLLARLHPVSKLQAFV